VGVLKTLPMPELGRQSGLDGIKYRLLGSYVIERGPILGRQDMTGHLPVQQQ
jgi:hypothetical protein